MAKITFCYSHFIGLFCCCVILLFSIFDIWFRTSSSCLFLTHRDVLLEICVFVTSVWKWALNEMFFYYHFCSSYQVTTEATHWNYWTTLNDECSEQRMKLKKNNMDLWLAMTEDILVKWVVAEGEEILVFYAAVYLISIFLIDLVVTHF